MGKRESTGVQPVTTNLTDRAILAYHSSYDETKMNLRETFCMVVKYKPTFD